MVWFGLLSLYKPSNNYLMDLAQKFSLVTGCWKQLRTRIWAKAWSKLNKIESDQTLDSIGLLTEEPIDYSLHSYPYPKGLR